jgi:hypothetical protein
MLCYAMMYCVIAAVANVVYCGGCYENRCSWLLRNVSNITRPQIVPIEKSVIFELVKRLQTIELLNSLDELYIQWVIYPYMDL